MPQAPVIPAATRRAVDDWLARGYAVEIASDGTLRVTPRKADGGVTQTDLVHWRE
jgi:hypothetical protein